MNAVTTATAFVLINCTLGKEERIIQDICKLSKDIVEVRATYGLHDIIMKVVSADTDELNALLALVRKIEDLRSTVTLMVIPGIGGKG